MTKPKPPEGDDLADMQHLLPPEHPEPPSTYVKRWPTWTTAGAAALSTRPADEAARLDDELQDRWHEQDEAEEQARQDAAEKRKLDLAEQRLRVSDRVERLKRRRGRRGNS
jgi:hypothetical protein